MYTVLYERYNRRTKKKRFQAGEDESRAALDENSEQRRDDDRPQDEIQTGQSVKDDADEQAEESRSNSSRQSSTSPAAALQDESADQQHPAETANDVRPRTLTVSGRPTCMLSQSRSQSHNLGHSMAVS